MSTTSTDIDLAVAGAHPGSETETLAINRRGFADVLARAQLCLDAGNLDAAAVYAGAAARSATHMHPGFYSSLELELVIFEIARKAGLTLTAGGPRQQSIPKHVLHVFTTVRGIGGHSKMATRWIEQDGERLHSVALTRQRADVIPAELSDAVARTGGRLHLLDQHRGGLLAWARRLQELSADVDLVVLHVNPEDMVPCLAFASHSWGPPVIYLDHADHLFWAGVTMSDVVCSLRDSGRRLAVAQRGVEADRCALLPIIVPPCKRTMTRLEARRQLRLPEDSVVLLSIARAVKFKPLDGVSLIGAIAPVLRSHKDAILLLVGPDPDQTIEEVSRQTGGRVIAYGPRTDTAAFLTAADIYLDSVPMGSTTSVLEAGIYSLPVVSVCLRERPEWQMFCVDSPGLTGQLVRVDGLGDFGVEVSRLIRDEAYRRALGERTQEQIASLHGVAAWHNALDELYRKAVTIPRVRSAKPPPTDVRQDPRHIVVPTTPGSDAGRLSDDQARLLPTRDRVRMCLQMTLAERRLRPSILAPEWLVVRARRWRHRASGWGQVRS